MRNFVLMLAAVILTACAGQPKNGETTYHQPAGAAPIVVRGSADYHSFSKTYSNIVITLNGQAVLRGDSLQLSGNHDGKPANADCQNIPSHWLVRNTVRGDLECTVFVGGQHVATIKI